MIFTEQEMSSRLTALKGRMKDQNIDLAFIVYPTDLYYFCGITLHATLLVPLENEPILFVQINMARAKKDSAIRNLQPSRGISTVIDYLRQTRVDGVVVGLEFDVLPVQIYHKLANALPEATFTDISPLILSIRSKKSSREINCIKKAAKISSYGFKLCEELISPGKTEHEVRLTVARKEFLLGAEIPEMRAWNKRMDWGVFASGENTTEISGYWMCETGSGIYPFRPYGPTYKKIEKGDIVCVNKGVAVHGYCVDEARTFVVGKATEQQAKIFASLCRAQEVMLKKAKHGVTARELYLAGWQEIDKAGYGKYFMAGAFYDFPYVGHGVGLEIDEPPMLTPSSRCVLEEGMVLAIEPKIIIPGWGGIDLEDTVLVTNDGGGILTETEWKLFEV